MPTMNFKEKIVLITGTSSGIGRDTARHLAKLGANVSMVGINAKCLNQVADEIKKSGAPTPLAIVADVLKDTKRIVDETIKHFGHLDVLINNVINDEIVTKDNAGDVNISEFDRVFDTNVRSVMTLTKLCVPHLEETCGNVVNVSSIAIPNAMSYCISKASLDQFTKCLAIDLAPKGIRVNLVDLAAVQTPIFETFRLKEEKVEKMINEYKLKYPVGRVGEVYNMSVAIAYLADDDSSSCLNGVLLPIDGIA